MAHELPYASNLSSTILEGKDWVREKKNESQDETKGSVFNIISLSFQKNILLGLEFLTYNLTTGEILCKLLIIVRYFLFNSINDDIHPIYSKHP